MFSYKYFICCFISLKLLSSTLACACDLPSEFFRPLPSDDEFSATFLELNGLSSTIIAALFDNSAPRLGLLGPSRSMELFLESISIAVIGVSLSRMPSSSRLFPVDLKRFDSILNLFSKKLSENLSNKLYNIICIIV
jgi:hypothetical protein